MSSLDDKWERAANVRAAFGEDDFDSPLNAFRQRYSSLFSGAFENRTWIENDSNFLLVTGTSCRGAQIQMGSLKIFILQRVLSIPAHGRGDICILDNQDTGMQIVLWGESMKHWLDRGVKYHHFPQEENLLGQVKAFFSPFEQWVEGVREIYMKGYDSEDAVPQSEKIAFVRSLFAPIRNLPDLYQHYLKNLWGPGSFANDIRSYLDTAVQPISASTTTPPNP